MTTAPPSSALAALLADWLVGQRWYAAKGGGRPVLEQAGGWRLTLPPTGPEDNPPGGASDDVVAEIHLVRAATADGGRTLYQVPLTFRTRPAPDLATALIGVADLPGLGRRHVYDGPHDPLFVSACVGLLSGRLPSDGTIRGVLARAAPPPGGPARVMGGEQSNTSVIIAADGPDPVMIKLFRVLHPGVNPDVVVATRLAAVGCDRVPAPVGYLEAEWDAGPDTAPSAGSDIGTDAGTVIGHLAYACEFVGGAQDAWREACTAVVAGTPFTNQAHGLGAATARVHADLARALPTRVGDPAALARMADGLLARARWAARVAPALAERALPAATRAAAAVRELRDPPLLQQVHGDLHLGQVLHSPRRGWLLLDFEGEPLRPLAERLEPDLALRDVAGMLRSFDYAARHHLVHAAPEDPRVAAATRWAAAARTAFLDGYAGQAGADPRERADLLAALELDKALYEVAYETLNRPDWVAIPLDAVRRLS